MTNVDQDILTILSCDIASRPAGAPSLDDVLPGVREVRLLAEALVVHFDPAMLPTMEAFAEAEQQCCSELTWQVNEAGRTLHVSGKPSQVEALARMFGVISDAQE